MQTRSFAQFLAREARQEAKFEFVDGEVFAMSGGIGDYPRIADNFRLEMPGQT